jgi:hypothetical protein
LIPQVFFYERESGKEYREKNYERIDPVAIWIKPIDVVLAHRRSEDLQSAVQGYEEN